MKFKTFFEKLLSNLIYSLNFSIFYVLLIIEGHVKQVKLINGGLNYEIT